MLYVYRVLCELVLSGVKRIDEPCEVKTRPNRPLPYLFRWRDRKWQVRRVIEVWRLESKWWTQDGPERRTFYRCVAARGNARRGGNTVVEIYRQQTSSKSRWVLARIAD